MEKLKLVIADDESLIRMDIKEMLEDAGHKVIGEGTNGRQAVNLAAELQPDLVIMDVKMPEMDGLTAAEEIFKKKLAPVLLLTAFSQEDIVKKAGSCGVLGYLVKPINEYNLLPAIEIAVSRYREIKQLEDELEKAKESLQQRKILAKAKGILMEVHGFSEDEAYHKMQQYSMSHQMTLKKVAEMIIASAEKK